MNSEDKVLGERVLCRMCLGGQVDGIRFGPVLQILIREPDVPAGQERLDGQVYLNLESAWSIFPDLATAKREVGRAFDITDDNAIEAICSVREQAIVYVELGEQTPHLFLGLHSGQVIGVNGQDDRCECWQMGVAFQPRRENWMVVAGISGVLAVWSPHA